MQFTQTQIIQSLAEALAWCEKELSWNVPLGEMNHLTGRIGELYAAMITRGQMADRVNQRGYDVVSADKERISVKTITTSTHVTVRKSTLSEVDRLMVLRLNVLGTSLSIEEVFDASMDEAIAVMREYDTTYHLHTYQKSADSNASEDADIVRTAMHGTISIHQHRDLSISAIRDGTPQSPVLPLLRDIAREIDVSPLNGRGNPKNTRTLGADIISALSEASRHT